MANFDRELTHTHKYMHTHTHVKLINLIIYLVPYIMADYEFKVRVWDCSVPPMIPNNIATQKK